MVAIVLVPKTGVQKLDTEIWSLTTIPTESLFLITFDSKEKSQRERGTRERGEEKAERAKSSRPSGVDVTVLPLRE